MNSRNQNKSLSSPSSKKADWDEGVQVGKRRKIVRGANMVREVRTRSDRAAAVNNVVGQDVVQKSVAAPVSNVDTEGGVVEFTKEDVEALLNERFKPKKKYDLKEKSDHLAERVKKLKVCIKWFQELEGTYLLEQEKLRSMIESTEKKYNELEVLKQNKEEELNSIIMELRKNYTALQESYVREEKDKLDAMDSLTMEIEARRAAERLHASLSDDLGKKEQELAGANQKVSSLNNDYKRLQEYNTSLQQYNSKLQTELATANETLKQVERDKASLMQNLSTLRGHSKSVQEQLNSSKTAQEDALKQKETLVTEVTCLKGELQQVRDDRDRQVTCVQTLTAEVAKYRDIFGKSSVHLDELKVKTNLMETRCSSQSDQIRTLQEQLAAANRKLQMSDLCALETRTDYEEQKKLTSDLQFRLAEAEHKILEGEVLRKKLHNTILELKGNIRVFCRVRPLLPEDGAGTEAKAISYPNSTESMGRAIDLMQNGLKHSFTFDKVLAPEISQEDCFVEISQLIQSALDGYKVCIFAYGQTGSGKTYTMMGKPGNHEQKGLIPRSLEQIFQTRQTLQNQGWKYEMQVSMLEIYNETIRDLLTSNRSSSDASGTSSSTKQYAIKHDANGNTHVSDLIIVDVRSSKEVSFLLDQAAQSRSVGKTQMNEHSSRSHFVFTLRISGVNESTEQQVQGVLNLIDLAGSERLSKSGATGDRLKETQAINKSLSSLSDVIFALAKKEDHVPFRNSKLTYLLQPCLGGDSKTLMFVNVSPDPTSIGESLCSLRFAARVNACEIGIPRRQTNVKPADSRLSYG